MDLDLKEMKKRIEKEKEKKEKAEGQIKEMRAGLIDAAFDGIVGGRLFAKSAFQISKGMRGRGWEISNWASNFGDEMVEAWEALKGVGVNQMTLASKEHKKSSYDLNSNVRVDKNYDRMVLLIGDDVEIGYLKEVVKDYGIRIDLDGINKVIENDDRYGKWSKLKDKIILSGMAEGLPMSGLDGFGDYLEVEEQYARKLHGAFKVQASGFGITYFKELRHDFDLMGIIPTELFMAMGRVMFTEIMEKE